MHVHTANVFSLLFLVLHAARETVYAPHIQSTRIYVLYMFIPSFFVHFVSVVMVAFIYWIGSYRTTPFHLQNAIINARLAVPVLLS